MEGFSVIICTYNRSALLNECLLSFTRQTNMPDNVEFLVINNNSMDDTEKVALSYVGKLPGLRCINETSVGLSYARNRGVAEAKYDWVCYMDDDAKAYPDFIERMFFLRKNYRFDGFGGMFYPWYIQKKPEWLAEDFGRMHLLREDIGPLKQRSFVAGGICAFNKQKILDAGGFPVDIGMRGNVIGYGEENILQEKMIRNGAVIGFDPQWKIDHLVADYKMQVGWHLQRAYAKGRDFQLTKGRISVPQKLFMGAKAVSQPLFSVIKNLPKLVLKKNYYRQNFIIDSFSHAYRLIGRLSANQ